MPSKFKKGASKKVVTRKEVRTIAKQAIRAEEESKGFQNTLGGTWGSVGNSWIEADVSSMTQGDGLTNREGRTIAITGLEVRGVLAQGSSETLADDYFNVFRMIIGLYQGGTLSPLQTAGATLNQSITRNSNTQSKLIKKFYDKYFALPVVCTEQGAGDGYTPSVRVVKFFKKFKKPIYVTYGDDTAGYPDKRLIISMISDSVAVPSPGFVAGYYRLYAKEV